MIQSNRTLVPVRVVTENLGYEVFWDNQTRTVKIIKFGDSNKTSLELKIGSNQVSYYNSKKNTNKLIQIDVAPLIVNNRTIVPLRAIAELCNENVSWDQSNRVAVVGEGYVTSPTKNYEARIQEARNRFNYLVNPNHRNIGYTELVYEYEAWILEILSNQVDDLMNDPNLWKFIQVRIITGIIIQQIYRVI